MDFFTRLAERTQGLTPPVQPILGSRFAQAPTTSFFSDVLVEEQASAPERSTDSTYAPTHRSPERLASTLEPIAPNGIAKAHANSRETRTNPKAILQSDATSEFEVPGEAQASTTNPAQATMPLSREGLDFPQETFRHPLVSELRAESHTAKAIANEPFSRDEKAGLASLEQGTEQAAADSLLLPFDPLEHSNQTAGQHMQLPRAESNAAIEFLSHVPEGLLEQTAGRSKVFVRPRVERTARRTEDARPQPEGSFDHREPARSSNDSAPPVIRVSIGRVEVRAILPPSTAVERPSPARAKPNLSLDDYLNRGEKG